MYPVYNLHTPLLNCSKIMSMEKRKSHFLGGRYSYPSIAFDSKLMTSSFYIIAIRYDICMVNTIIYAECMLNCIIKHSLSFSLSLSLSNINTPVNFIAPNWSGKKVEFWQFCKNIQLGGGGIFDWQIVFSNGNWGGSRTRTSNFLPEAGHWIPLPPPLNQRPFHYHGVYWFTDTIW